MATVPLAPAAEAARLLALDAISPIAGFAIVAGAAAGGGATGVGTLGEPKPIIKSYPLVSPSLTPSRAEAQ